MDILHRILNGQHDQVADHSMLDQYQQAVQVAPPEVVAQAQEDAIKQLSPAERQQLLDQFRQAHNDPNQSFSFPGFDQGRVSATPAHLSSMMALAQQEQPDLLQSILSGGGGSSPVMKALMAGVIGMVMQQMLGGGASANTGQLGGGLLGSILGQMMGGGKQGGGGTSQSHDDSQASTGGGGLGDILGQVLGGGGGGGLGDILGQMTGGKQGDDTTSQSDNPLDLPADSGIDVEQQSEGEQPKSRR